MPVCQKEVLGSTYSCRLIEPVQKTLPTSHKLCEQIVLVCTIYHLEEGGLSIGNCFGAVQTNMYTCGGWGFKASSSSDCGSWITSGDTGAYLDLEIKYKVRMGAQCGNNCSLKLGCSPEKSPCRKWSAGSTKTLEANSPRMEAEGDRVCTV